MAEANRGKAEHGNGRKRNCHPESYNTFRNEFYNMNHKHRGKALIFSHEQFDQHLNVSPRPGTVKDCQVLEKCLKELSFSVEVFSDLTYDEIIAHIKRTAKANHSKNDCLLIVVLSHGESGKLYAKNVDYRSEKLWCWFTDEMCPTLAGKPRLFIFQACQGEDYDGGITLTSDIKKDVVETDGWFESHKIPIHRDFLLALATVPGYYAWRNRTDGSWFIQALCEELCDSATEMDILTLLTFVSQKVALNYESNTDDDLTKDKKEVPCFYSMLTRRLVFTKKPSSSSTKSFIDYFKECSINN